ncbi:hypothetical protein ACS0TY_029117 [Phlomoides rotata]
MLCSDCTKNPPTLSPTSGAGIVQEIGGFSTYVTGNQDSKLAIVLLSDAFGYEAPRFRELADKVASLGYWVVVPDLLYGDPFSFEKHTSTTWIHGHCPDKGCEDAKAVIDALKSKGVSKIGVAGFCWGGMLAVRLAALEDYIQAAVLLHPGVITEEQINEVKAPLALLIAENDQICPTELLIHIGEILSAKSEVDSFVKVYPGVDHGWTLRYDDEFAVKSAEEAQSDMINWLSKYIK